MNRRHLALFALFTLASCATPPAPVPAPPPSEPPAAEELEPLVGELLQNAADGCPADTPPVPLQGRRPQYTAEAMLKRVQGVSRVACVVDVDGLPKRCRVLQSLGVMDEPILEAVRTYRFRPAVVCGKPMATDYTFNTHMGFKQ